MKEYFFISGLPRSGSTLLSAILRQNPLFHADISSPVLNLMKGAIDTLTSSESNLVFQENRRKTLLTHIINGYYDGVSNPVVFDSNRGWTADTSLLKALFPTTKIICCVRDVEWILDSFEVIASKNCFYTNTLMDQESIHSVETRCADLMDVRKSGAVIKPWHWLQEGLALNPDMILLVDYENLCRDPKGSMQKIYDFLGKKYYDHDFSNVEYENELYDRALNKKGLHTVRGKVEWVKRRSVLPQYVFDKYRIMNFWKNSDLIYG